MSSKKEQYFKLFASCILVDGVSESLICDIERREFYDLPNYCIEILKMTSSMSVSAIKEKYSIEEGNSIDNFFAHFVKQEIGFFTFEPELFPDIDLTWESPSTITNAVIELNSFKKSDFENIIHQLDHLACRAIQIRCLEPISLIELQLLVDTFYDTRINNVDLLIPYNKKEKNSNWFTLIEKQSRINKIIVYAAPNDLILKNKNILLNKRIIYFKKDIRVDSSEIISVNRFTTNVDMFTEAQKHNLGLNRKICIDKNGEIKNYLSHETSFGNIKNNKLTSIVSKNEFQEKWFISNNEIEVCNVCQYRYMCVSNSDLKKENNKYYKVDKCNFDPFKNCWIQD